MTRVHPELMSKPVLIAHLKQAQAAARTWRAKYELARHSITDDTWRDQSAAEVGREATKLLDIIGTDPDAEQHRATLEAELDASWAARTTACDTHGCRRRLDAIGVCVKHGASGSHQVAS